MLDDALFSAKKLIAPETLPKQIEKLDVERVEYTDLTAFYVFHLPASDFHTITIQGDTESFVYGGFGTIAIRSTALQSLDLEKPVSIEIVSQKSSTSFSHDTYTSPVVVFKKTMTLASGFREERNENITAVEENGNVLVRGIVMKGKNVKSDIILTLPDGNVEKYAFDRADLDTDGYMKRGRVFEKTIPLKQVGVYLVEVNYDNGFAAYNGPITYGDILAIAPNNYDGTEKKIGSADSLAVASESLAFVNQVRARSSKSALLLDDTLSRLATIKANDMAANNNLSHTDSHGDKISGTAKRNSIKIAGAVGENIAG